MSSQRAVRALTPDALPEMLQGGACTKPGIDLPELPCEIAGRRTTRVGISSSLLIGEDEGVSSIVTGVRMRPDMLVIGGTNMNEAWRQRVPHVELK
jgi:hypothetical protein